MFTAAVISIIFLEYPLVQIIFTGLFSYIIIRIVVSFPNLSIFGIRKENLRKGFSDTKFLFFGLVLIIRPVFILIESGLALEQPDPLSHITDPMIGLVAIVAIGPLIEEIIFRGIIQERTSWYFSDASSIIFSSFLFVIFHWTPSDITIFVATSCFRFVRSLFYGAIYLKTKSILHSFAGHALVNLYAPVFLILHT
ncbi:MAG: CPBP family intramembrane glutamic endopeptidase [Candidatus Thorarchaeota archaeon]